MKNINKKIISLLIVITIMFWFNGVSAMWGFGKMISSEERSKLQSMSRENRKEYMKKLKEKYNFSWWKQSEKNGKGKMWERKWNGDAKEWHNPSDMIKDIKKQDLDFKELDLLKKQYEEEMMANELYMSFYKQYGINTFKKIANSESKHMNAVQALLTRYNIDTPTNYVHIQKLYDELKAQWSVSLKDALEVGVKIEIVDIDDIITAIKSSDNDDIKTVFVNIGGASYNHMRGFVKALDNNGLTTNIDYSDYIDENDINTKGPIKVKLAEKLESEWIKLPKNATSKAIKLKCDKEKAEKNKKSWYHNKWHSDKNKMSKTKKDQYRKLFKTKYKSKIDSLGDEKLKAILPKINLLKEKVQNSTTYSEEKKGSTIALLEALKEIIEEKFASNNIINSLLK